MNKSVKYLEVIDKFKELIADDRFYVGSKLPSERELSALWGVNRVTLRRAIDELVKQGIVNKVQGSGNYLLSKNVLNNMYELMSCTQDVLSKGLVPQRTVLEHSLKPASLQESVILEMQAGDELFVLERIYRVENDVINITKTHLPHALFPGIEDMDFSEKSLYEVIENSYGYEILTARRNISAVAADDRIANYLEVDSGFPVLYFDAVTKARVNNKICSIEHFQSHYRTDKFSFFINQMRHKEKK